MNALLLTAHGSRRDESNAEIIALAKEIQTVASDQFDTVRCAFLQFTDPLFHAQVADLVAQGADTIIVFPYFITAGSHVLKDIPELVEKAKRQYPKVSFTVTPHFGQFKGIKQLILKEFRKEQPNGTHL